MTALEFAFTALVFGDDACVACLLLVVIPVLMGILQGNLRFDFRIPVVLVILFLFVAIIPLFSVSVGWRFDYAYILLSMFLWPLWIPSTITYFKAPDETWPVLAYGVMWFRILFAALLSLVIYMITWMLYCKWQQTNITSASGQDDVAGA